MTSGRSDLVDVPVDLKHETDKAFLVDKGDGEEIWVPKSQCELELTKGSHGTLTLPEWLALEKGLI